MTRRKKGGDRAEASELENQVEIRPLHSTLSRDELLNQLNRARAHVQLALSNIPRDYDELGAAAGDLIDALQHELDELE